MNIVQEEIQSIIDENNIAQEQFSEFLQDKNTMASLSHLYQVVVWARQR